MSFISKVKPAIDRSLICFTTGKRGIPLFFWLFLSAAQADTDLEILEVQLGMASTFVSELDAHAGSCLEAGATSAACAAFRLAINVEALTHYQALCEPLIKWRDEMIVQHSDLDKDANALATEEAERKLQLLLELETSCGNRTLTTRTKHVIAAYSLTTSSRTRPLRPLLPAMTGAETQRSNLLDSLSENHDRLRAETADLWRRLQIENVWRTEQQLKIDLSNPSLQ